jgi:ribosomal protein L5
MQNMFLYYKYNIRVQLLLKYPAKKIKELMQSVLKKVLFEANIDDLKSNYYIYIYNIAILIRLVANKFLYVRRVNKNYNVNKIYFGVNLKGSHMYQFLDVFTCLLLPLFESFNVLLDLNKFDIFGNLQYRLIYCDPVFMSKNAVTVWSPLYNVNLKVCFNTPDKIVNYNILQYLKFKWYI